MADNGTLGELMDQFRTIGKVEGLVMAAKLCGDRGQPDLAVALATLAQKYNRGTDNMIETAMKLKGEIDCDRS